MQNGFQVPACDIEVFYGDYLMWLKDLFTVVYIKNSRLSKVEELFHLIAKTSRDSKEIVSMAPLTNDGFDIAWIFLLIYLCSIRLPDITLSRCEQQLKERKTPTWSDFDYFLSAPYQTLDTVADLRASSSIQLQTNVDSNQYNNAINFHASCQLCPRAV